MAGGSKTQLVDRGTGRPSEARITGFRLWVNALVGGAVTLDVEVTEDDPLVANPQLIPVGVEVVGGFAAIPEAVGDWSHLRIDGFGGILTHDITLVTESTAVAVAPFLTPIAAERDDVLTPLGSLNGEWDHLRVDSEGALWSTLRAEVLESEAAGGGTEMVVVGGEDSNGDWEWFHFDDAGNLRIVDLTTVNDGSPASASPALIPPGAVRDDSILAALVDAAGDWVHLRVNEHGALWVAAQTESFEGDTAPTVSGTLIGATTLAVRDDDISGPPAHVVDGDFTTLRTDSRGAQWVREVTMTDHLSGSTNGRPIQITQVATLGDTIHTAIATAGLVDKVWIYLSNTSNVQETVTIEFGAAGGGLELDFVVPANDTILAVSGYAIGGAAGQLITAFATAANVVNVAGYFERHVNP